MNTRSRGLPLVDFLVLMAFLGVALVGASIFLGPAIISYCDTLVGESAWNGNGIPLDHYTEWLSSETLGTTAPNQHAIDKHGDDAKVVYKSLAGTDAATKCPDDRVRQYYHPVQRKYIIRCWVDGINDLFMVLGEDKDRGLFNLTAYRGSWSDTYASMTNNGGWVEAVAP